MAGARIMVPLGLSIAFALAAVTIAPRAFEAESLLAARDDPVALADRAVARSFDAAVAEREINAALAAKDADLAQSFLELAREQKLAVDPDLAAKVELANSGRSDRRALARELRTRPHHRRAGRSFRTGRHGGRRSLRVRGYPRCRA